MDEHGVASDIDRLTIDDNLAAGDNDGVEATVELASGLAGASLLDHDGITLLLGLLLAKDGEASVLAGSVLAARGRSRPGPDHVNLNVLVKVRGDVVRLLAAGRARVLDLLSIVSDQR